MRSMSMRGQDSPRNFHCEKLDHESNRDPLAAYLRATYENKRAFMSLLGQLLQELQKKIVSHIHSSKMYGERSAALSGDEAREELHGGGFVSSP